MKKRRYFVWEDSQDCWCYIGDLLSDLEERVGIEETESESLEDGLSFKCLWMTDQEVADIPEC